MLIDGDVTDTSVIPCGGLERFVGICATLPRQLWRPEVCKSLADFTPTSKQIQMEILVEKREEFLTAGYVVFEKIVPVSQTKFVQFVQNQNIVKTRLVFPTIDRNAEILLAGFNDRFSGTNFPLS